MQNQIHRLPKMVEGDDQKRAAKCMDAIQEVLKAFDCAMAPIIVLGPQGVVNATVSVQPIPRQPEMPPEVQKAAKEAIDKQNNADLKGPEAEDNVKASVEQKDGFSVKDSRRKM